MKKIIYDLGSNDGCNIPYYLLKSDLVVAVEANPILCQLIKKVFEKDIIDGRLIVENCIVTALSNNEDKEFYIHKRKHVLSQFLLPSQEVLNSYYKIKVNSRNILSIIKDHGTPYYIKIDLENYDYYILKELFLQKIYPKYLSVEAHNENVYDLIIENGKYKSFKLVDGHTVEKKYRNRIIKNINYSFKRHSAGPFGNDIDGQWMTEENFRFLLSVVGFGWKDIHCKLEDKPGEY
jgi:FkbM family methyltransferase